MDKKELSDMSEMMMELHEGLKTLVGNLKPVWKWLKKHWDQFVHLIWLAIFVIVAMLTGNDIWIAVGVFPAIFYSLIWAIKKKS
jgi:hypothetical protein